ncbi:dTDP-4-dehydrorhamnose reductase [Pelagibacterium sp.]|uniref:dTDP-4-dehydrorhamnose reductase n=1 Tax=Pelagibacterium sp. TaxID=1967288 RepID=UPI003A91E7E5
MKLLVTGKAGQVVTALIERGATQGVEIVAMGRPELDLANPQEGLFRIAVVKPDAIVSAAAYTSVDKAEAEADLAERINAHGPAALAQLAGELDIPIIHLSTDYVFDGSKLSPYVETDQTNPLGVYGATKLAGERAVASATDNHAILRTAWVYSPFGNNFLKTMLKLASTRPELRVVDDQHGNPTSALDIADAVIKVAGNLLARPDHQSLRGTFHLTGTGEVSWADFALEIFAQSARLGGPSANVRRISTVDYPTPAKRPANSQLDTTKLHSVHGITMPDWQSSTHNTIARLLAGAEDQKMEECHA